MPRSRVSQIAVEMLAYNTSSEAFTDSEIAGLRDDPDTLLQRLPEVTLNSKPCSKHSEVLSRDLPSAAAKFRNIQSSSNMI